MEQRYVGASGLKVSRLGLGTMTWGRDTDEHESRDQLSAFLDAGGTLVDTAAGYGDGAAEELLGQLLPEVSSREDVVLCTKAGISRRTGERVVDTSRRAMLAALDGSLTRLGTDHVDLWLAHTWCEDVPLEETLSALESAVISGRARYVGISNYCGWQSARAATLVATGGAPPLVANQVEYSLLSRGIEAEVVPSASAHGLGVLAWSPLGRGVLTGKYRTGTPADSRAASPHFASFVDRYLDERATGIVDAVVTAADGLGCSPAEIALAWVRDQPGVSAAVVGARTAAQLRGTLTSEDVELPQQIRDALDEVSR
jgi:aryl-alcohol dehydrogenase-like predicted oxidoreductase